MNKMNKIIYLLSKKYKIHFYIDKRISSMKDYYIDFYTLKNDFDYCLFATLEIYKAKYSNLEIYFYNDLLKKYKTKKNQ